MLGQPRSRELAELRGIGQRLELRSLALLEPDLLAERIGHHQDVGKDDRRIEVEPRIGCKVTSTALSGV